MVVSGAGVSREPAAAGREAARTPAVVVWHDLECGDYRVDLPIWLALAARLGGPILDVGAGTGRVTLTVAQAGHAVTAVDRDSALLDALRERAAGLPVETVCADARSLTLGRRDYALCVMPMQTIQLLEGADGRVAFLRHAREHVRDGGLVACAILAELEPFDCSDGRIGPAAERTRVDGLEYVSRAIRVAESRRMVTIERERRILRPSASGEQTDSGTELARERDVIELDRLSVARLERDARAAGLHAEPALEIAATDEHVGSTVVVLRV
ncbi:MAG TPA: class I SAM-dependent methyltransferase [Solirubrobacteraceae bacterium]